MGKSTKTLISIGVFLVVAIGGRALISVLRPQNDKTLITQALNESIKASKEGRPGGVMDKLSDNLKLNGTDESGNRQVIAKFIRESKPNVTVETIEPIVIGDEATVVSPVDLDANFLGMSANRHIKEATLVFRKEEDHDWLFIPTRRWKLAEVHVSPEAVADLIQQ